MERLCGTAEREEEPIAADKQACLNEIANGNSRHRIGNGDGRRAADSQLQCAGRLNANSSRGRSNDVLNIDECGGWTGVSDVGDQSLGGTTCQRLERGLSLVVYQGCRGGRRSERPTVDDSWRGQNRYDSVDEPRKTHRRQSDRGGPIAEKLEYDDEESAVDDVGWIAKQNLGVLNGPGRLASHVCEGERG